MSNRAKGVFIGSVIFSIGTVYAVHYAQEVERDNMFQGVLKDQKRVELKKEQKERLLDYENQIKRREDLLQLQTNK